MSDDWQLLKDTLTHTPMLVISVSPQGPVGLLREGAALFSGLNEMLRHGSGYPLIERLRLELQASADQTPAGYASQAEMPGAAHAASDAGVGAPAELRRPAARPAGAGAQPPEKDLDTLRRETLEHCRRANQVLIHQATPEEAAYYRRGLLWVCLQIARAAREGGGWFGIGAVQVTDAEKEALRQIAYAFGLPASEAMIEHLPDAPARPMPAELAGRLSPEEWSLVRQAPLWTSFAVVAAHPSGTVGLSRELNVLPVALQDARRQHPTNRLLAAVWEDLSTQLQEMMRALNADLPKPPGAGQAGQRALVEHAIRRIGQAAEVLDARIEQGEAAEFKQMLLNLARQVAAAAREGGFWGLGGQTISTREQDALQQIAATLGLEA